MGNGIINQRATPISLKDLESLIGLNWLDGLKELDSMNCGINSSMVNNSPKESKQRERDTLVVMSLKLRVVIIVLTIPCHMR